MGEYNFTKFTDVGSKHEERISITKSDFIGLPRDFCAKNRIGTDMRVELYHTPKSDSGVIAVGLRFLLVKEMTEDQKKQSYNVNYSDKNSSAAISARSFFRSVGVDTTKYGGKYDAKKIDQPGIGKIFVIELEDKNQ